MNLEEEEFDGLTAMQQIEMAEYSSDDNDDDIPVSEVLRMFRFSFFSNGKKFRRLLSFSEQARTLGTFFFLHFLRQVNCFPQSRKDCACWFYKLRCSSKCVGFQTSGK